jgi:hypothetical protein
MWFPSPFLSHPNRRWGRVRVEMFMPLTPRWGPRVARPLVVTRSELPLTVNMLTDHDKCSAPFLRVLLIYDHDA